MLRELVRQNPQIAQSRLASIVAEDGTGLYTVDVGGSRYYNVVSSGRAEYHVGDQVQVQFLDGKPEILP